MKIMVIESAVKMKVFSASYDSVAAQFKSFSGWESLKIINI